MKLRYLAILMFLVTGFASSLTAQSNQPSSKTSQQTSTQKERGSENLPVIVKVHPTEKSQAELDAEKEKQESDRQLVSLTGDLAKYTKLLFVATALLVFVTAGLVVLGFIQSGDSKRSIAAAEMSAKTAERALTELERPYLFVLDYNWLLKERAAAENKKVGWIYSVVNAGKLPAIIKNVTFGLTFGDTIPALEDVPKINDLITGPVVGGGEKRVLTQALSESDAGQSLEFEIKGGLAIIPAIAFNAGRVIAKISIEYDGPITKGHVTTACWEWHGVKYAFTQHGGDEHNYRT